jgi:hypothetical protein
MPKHCMGCMLLHSVCRHVRQAGSILRCRARFLGHSSAVGTVALWWDRVGGTDGMLPNLWIVDGVQQVTDTSAVGCVCWVLVLKR